MYFLPVLLAASSRSRHGLLLWCDLTFLLEDMASVCMYRKEGLLRLLMPPVLLDGLVLWLCVTLIPSLGD